MLINIISFSIVALLMFYKMNWKLREDRLGLEEYGLNKSNGIVKWDFHI